jgi:hypothetical protein
MKRLLLFTFLLLGFSIPLMAEEAASQPSPLPVSPVEMIPRDIRKPDSIPGTQLSLDFPTTGSVILYLPEGYAPPVDGAVNLTVHFHGATWFAIEEHRRRGLREPLVALALGEGSTVYRQPFEDPSSFPTFLSTVESALKHNTELQEIRIASVSLTSYSAGFGAVREILKTPENHTIIRRIILGDSSYGSLDPTLLEKGERVVIPEHIAPWAAFGKLALNGEKTLLMTSSEIQPGSYAGTHEVCRAVTLELGLEIHSPTQDPELSITAETPYPLAQRAQQGGFLWWGYKGQDARVHMTLARRLGDAWAALDAAGLP